MSQDRQDNSPALGGRHRSRQTGQEPRLGGETALHHLAMSLESDDWQTRRRAADALRELGPGAVTLMIEALRSENMHTRRVAAQSLGLMGGAEAVEALIGALEDGQESVRQTALLGLVRNVTRVSTHSGRVRVLRALLAVVSANSRMYRLLGESRDDLVREAAACLLDENGTVTRLSWKLLQSSRIVIGLRRHGRIRYALQLIGCLASVSTEFEGDDLAVINTARSELVSDLQIVVSTGSRTSEVTAARERLSTYPTAQYARIYRLLLRAADPRVRSTAIDAVRIEKNTDAAPPLIDILMNDPEWDVRRMAPGMLAWLLDELALPILEEALQRETMWLVWDQIIEALGQINPARAVTHCLDMAASGNDRSMRSTALRQLADLLSVVPFSADTTERAFALFMAAYPAGGFPLTYACFDGLAALARLEAPGGIAARAEDQLFTLLSGDNYHGWSYAIFTLPEIAPELATRYWITRLGDMSPSRHNGYQRPGQRHVRRICDEAAERLEQIGTPEALAAVEKWRRRGFLSRFLTWLFAFLPSGET